MARQITLAPDVADVLRAATIDGDALRLPGELDRSLYLSVDKVLKALGAKWTRARKAHVFADDDARAQLEQALRAGNVTPPDTMGYFPTPPELAARVVELARVEPHHHVLEPSAGTGALADALRPQVHPDRLCLIEIQPKHARVLMDKGYVVTVDDFLTTKQLSARGYDRVVMNPPFERGSDVRHVIRGLALTAPGGRLVAVMSTHVLHASTMQATALRDRLVELEAHIEHNPERSFRHAGTDVDTIIVAVDKPALGQ